MIQILLPPPRRPLLAARDISKRATPVVPEGEPFIDKEGNIHPPVEADPTGAPKP